LQPIGGRSPRRVRQGLRSVGVPPSAATAVRGTADVTADWCSAALAATIGEAEVIAVTIEPVGTGQVSDTVRLHLEYDEPHAGPPTLIAKVPAAAEDSRFAARLTRTYEIEASFYRDLAADLPVRTPRCHYSAHDAATDGYVVLLEDVSPARQGDQLHGCPVAEIEAAIDELALLHAPRWGDEALTQIGWLHRAQPENIANLVALVNLAAGPFRERYRDRLSAETLALAGRLLPRLGAQLGHRRRPWTIVHGDFRADNLLFGGDRVVVVDWQTVSLGPGPADLSYLLGASLTPDDRRVHEAALVDRYVERLDARGVAVDRDDVWEAYRRHTFGGLVMAILASGLVQRTKRGDEMFVAMAERHARHALDLDAEALI
jgi:hypothetical protein